MVVINKKQQKIMCHKGRDCGPTTVRRKLARRLSAECKNAQNFSGDKK
jgi:hypothetical protein